MDASEPRSTRQEEEEGDTLTSLAACSPELLSSQEEGSQLQRLVLGGGQTPEEVPHATLRSQLSVLSLAERLQRIKKRPRRSKEDMLPEVMQQSLNEKSKSTGEGKGGSTSRMRITGTKAWSSCQALWSTKRTRYRLPISSLTVHI
ncbi:uncharacterized protein [Lepidochelys kempii]|uniref:uncharacterized protein isoform X2 n=1 Tax=Lepidochelys kempii TaxID=8472 RepID=UPI003C6EC381